MSGSMAAASKRSAPKREKCQNVFQCDMCEYHTERIFNFKRHMDGNHAKKVYCNNESDRCACLEDDCSFCCRRTCDLREHLKSSHGFTFNIEVVKHNSYTEFDKWKTAYQIENYCYFIKSTGQKEDKKQSAKVLYFQCNRSGSLSKKGTGKRTIKSQGSCKINSSCTATMVVTVSSDGSTTTEVCHDHYGHQNDLQHMRLSQKMRNEIAAKIHQGISRERILDDMRDSMSQLTRDHLLTKKDIDNIEMSFGLNSVQRHANDHVSVSLMLEEWKKLEENPVLFAKLQGSKSPDGYDLADEDLMIIIQNTKQKIMLQQFGPKGVCMDSTHGTNGYDFPLTTIMVIDEFGEGYPVAWCLSNHEDFTTLCIMMQEIKKNCCLIDAAWIMTDMAPQFYNAWVAVMCTHSHRSLKLLCTWHVDRAWREELHRKVGNIELEAETYKQLRTVLEETDEKVFENNLQLLLDVMKCNPALDKFSSYFRQFWPERKREWAFVFRQGTGINTNMYVESFHKVFKYGYLRGRVNKRIDNCLAALVKFSRDKAFERIIKLTKGKVSARIGAIRERHVKSIETSLDCIKQIDEGNFEVQGESDMIYYVKACQPGSLRNCCKLQCYECGICIHAFNCSCPDSLATTAICKHIHLVARWATKHNSFIGAPSCSRTHIPQDDEIKELTSISMCNTGVDIEKRKMSIQGKFLEIMTAVRECHDVDILNSVDKQLNICQNLFQAMSSTPTQNTLESPLAKKMKTNKNIERQPRFYSTKKKTRKTKVRYGKPTMEDKEHIIKNMEVSAERGWTCSICKEQSCEAMVQCDYCDRWMDWKCAKITSEPEDDWYCFDCKQRK